MEQIFIFEPTYQDFKKEVAIQKQNGFAHVTGSTYIKSIETGSPEQNKIAELNDVLEFYSINLYNDYGEEKLAIQNDPDNFYSMITEYLEKDFKITTGSIYIETIKLDGYSDIKRCYTTWFCCVMYKN